MSNESTKSLSTKFFTSVHSQFWIGTFLGGLLVPVAQSAADVLTAKRAESIKQQVVLLMVEINNLYKNTPKTIEAATIAVNQLDNHKKYTKEYMLPDGFDSAHNFAKTVLADLQAQEKARLTKEEEAKAKAQAEQARRDAEAVEHAQRVQKEQQAAALAAEAHAAARRNEEAQNRAAQAAQARRESFLQRSIAF